MPNFTNDPVVSKTGSDPAVHGESEGTGVWGESTTWMGVYGKSDSSTGGAGVMGEASGTGVIGISRTWMGVYGESESTTGGAGVMGKATGPGVIGVSQTWHGAYGETESTTGGAGVWGEAKGPGAGVVGKAVGGIGVWGASDTGEAVHAETHSHDVAAIAAYNLAADGTGAALFAKKEGTIGHAGFFVGDVFVTGTLTVQTDIVLTGGDFAEEFDSAVATEIEPGTVMVLDDHGALQPSEKAYDRRVAGVVSGAGEYRPGLILDRRDSSQNRMPVALVGKVYCMVDAGYASIEVGDLLTTSPTRGHAMKAVDRSAAFGAVIGKALKNFSGGRGFVPILVALQ